MKNSSLVIASIIAIFFLSGFTIFLYKSILEGDISIPGIGPKTQLEESLKERYRRDPDYPRQILEGFITEVKTSQDEEKKFVAFKVKINVSKIFPEEVPFDKEVMVLTDEKTTFFLFDFETDDKSLINIEDFVVGLPVVMVIEGTNDNILTQETFSALKMTKIIPLPK